MVITAARRLEAADCRPDENHPKSLTGKHFGKALRFESLDRMITRPLAGVGFSLPRGWRAAFGVRPTGANAT